MNLSRQTKDYIATQRAKGRTKQTIDCYSARIDALVTYLRSNYYPLEQVSDIQLTHIQAYHDDLIEKGLSTATRRAYLATIRVFLTWCRKHEPQPNTLSWIEHVELPQRQRQLPPTPLSIDQIQRLISANPSTRDRAILTIMYSCGLRRSEVVALNVGDLFINRQQLLVHGKGGKDRMVPIATFALNALQSYLDTRAPVPTTNDPMFVTSPKHGPQRLTTNYLSTLFRRMPNPTDRNIHPHLLRHTYAVHLLRGGADVRHVQALLGHASPDTTNQYLGLVKDEIKRAYDRAMKKILSSKEPTRESIKRAA